MHLEALVSALGSRDDRGIADERVVDARVGHEVGLELVEIDVEGTVEAQRRRNGADDLCNQAVEVLVAGARDVQVAAADVVDGLVVDEERAVRVLDGAVGRQDSVVRLDNGRGHTRSRIDGELELRLLAVLGREALEEQRAEARAGTTAKRVEDQEALKGIAVVWGPSARFVLLQGLLAWPGLGSFLPATRRTRSMTLSTISLPIV